jgi:hypothetical protein
MTSMPNFVFDIKVIHRVLYLVRYRVGTISGTIYINEPGGSKFV